MNYQKINNALVNSDRSINSYVKNHTFYKYLLNNGLAYFFSKNISNKSNYIEQRLIKAGDHFENKFVKTLTLINRVCKKSNIKYLLFKTVKELNEVVDGDIDLFVKEKDFRKFISVMEIEGFRCIAEDHLKGSCIKKGYLKVEPRVDIAYHGMVVVPEKVIWKNSEKTKIDNMAILKTTKEIDVLHALLNIMYGPNYLKLYTLIVYKMTTPNNLIKLTKGFAKKDLNEIVHWIEANNEIKGKFPLFLENRRYLNWWQKRVFRSKKIGILNKLKLISYFFYSKYLYLLTGKLVLTHDWGIFYD